MLHLFHDNLTDILIIDGRCLLFTGFLAHKDITDDIRKVRFLDRQDEKVLAVVELNYDFSFKLVTDDSMLINFLEKHVEVVK